LADGLSGLVFSMEMNEKKIHDCVFGTRLKINTAKMGTNRLSQSEYQQIINECNNYAYQNLFISRKSGINPAFVQNMIRMRKRSGRLDFVVIDYIQRMTASGESKTKEMEKCATKLADITRDENVIMIILSQLSGEAEKRNSGAPIYSYIKESQAIVEAADVIIILEDPNRGKEPDGLDIPEFKNLNAVVLQRDGASDIWIKLRARLQYSKFNCEEKHHTGGEL
jgi:replicative DNA helicase